MIGQILIYRYNGLHNAVEGMDRNIYTLLNVPTKEEFKPMVLEALDHVPPGKGYVLARWNGKTWLLEKDSNNPQREYVRHEIMWHPLLDKFSI